MSNDLVVIKDKKIRQSNHLIESPYAQEFSAHEIKLFEIAVASCTQDDISFVERKSDKEFFISNRELAKLLNTKPNVISMEIEKTANRIMKKMLHLRKILPDGTVEFEMINIIPYARYKDGIFKFRLNYAIIPYLLEINKNFTEYQLNYLLAMNSAYAIKLYKLLYQYKKIKTRKFSIDDLKTQFGLHSKYALYGDFKNRILEPSIKQINARTDLNVSYKEIKFGRKVDKIEFLFTPQNNPVHPEFLSENDSNDILDIEGLLGEFSSKISSVTKQMLIKYMEIKNLDYVESSISYAKINAKTNFDKYLSDTLENGWAEVEMKKILSLKARKKKEKEIKIQENVEKSTITETEKRNKAAVENEWNDLSDIDRFKYNECSLKILGQYKEKLEVFNDIINILPLCIYAVNNKKSYMPQIENYIKRILNLNLEIADI